jgi:predicted GNAT family acetyltransferase
LASPVEHGGVLAIEIGTAGRGVEYLVLDADTHPRRIDAAAQQALGARDPWVTVPTRDAARVGDRLREHGLRSSSLPEWMMSIQLGSQRRTALPDPYVAELDVTGRVVRLRLVTDTGQLAASAQVAVVDDCAVPDKVETTAEHRRRGLGGAMMTALVDAAVELGARRGLLMASTQGRALYTSLGWATLCPVVVGRLWD